MKNFFIDRMAPINKIKSERQSAGKRFNKKQ